MNLDDTIVATSSAPAGAPRGIVRISGPQACDIAGQLVGGDRNPAWPTRPAIVPVDLRLPGDRTLAARLFVWPGSRSFTAQQTVEVHTLGARPLLEVILRHAREAGARLAEPGEFTLRAFLAGRIDLTQAEAVLGVIDANSDAELKTSLKQLAGGLAAPLAALREELLMLLAEIEAGLDFADEDIEFIEPDVLVERLGTVHDQVAALAEQVARRKLDSSRPRVVLVGEVNAGKSSLFNALAERFGTATQQTRAIESPQRGATRDYLTAEVRLAGIDCLLVDTAGVDDVAEHTIESHAQASSQTARESADLLLHCVDVASSVSNDYAPRDRILLVHTKVDERNHKLDSIATSAHTGLGLDELATAVATQLAQQDCDLVPSTAERSAASFASAESAINSALSWAADGGNEELVATELRQALDGLGRVAGTVHTDDVLDRIFSRFCIGK